MKVTKCRECGSKRIELMQSRFKMHAICKKCCASVAYDRDDLEGLYKPIEGMTYIRPKSDGTVDDTCSVFTILKVDYGKKKILARVTNDYGKRFECIGSIALNMLDKAIHIEDVKEVKHG